MEKTELREQLQHLNQGAISVFVYFVMKTGVVEMANIHETAVLGLKRQLLDKVQGLISDLESDDFSLLRLSTADERNNAIYEYDLSEETYPNSFKDMLKVEEYDEDLDYWMNGQCFDRHDNVKDIDAVIYSLGLGDFSLITYRKCYPYEAFEVNKGFLWFNEDNQKVPVDSPLIRLDGKFDFFLIDGHFIINNISVLERYSDIKVVLQNEAQHCVEDIEEANLISDMTEFRSRINIDVPFARKVMKVANDSVVIRRLKNHQLTNNDIMNFIATRPSLAEALKFEGDKLDLSTKKSQNAFLKLLDDSFLHSMLTNLDYTSNSKDLE